MVKNKSLFLVLVFFAVIIFGLWYYFGWYMNSSQIRARCWNQKWVQESEWHWQQYHFNNCLLNHGLNPVIWDDFRRWGM